MPQQAEKSAFLQILNIIRQEWPTRDQQGRPFSTGTFNLLTGRKVPVDPRILSLLDVKDEPFK